MLFLKTKDLYSPKTDNFDIITIRSQICDLLMILIWLRMVRYLFIFLYFIFLFCFWEFLDFQFSDVCTTYVAAERTVVYPPAGRRLYSVGRVLRVL